MMDRRVLLLDQLAKASHLVVQSKDRIQRHKASIAEQELAGRATAKAQELLEMAIATHAAQVTARDRLKALISQL